MKSVIFLMLLISFYTRAQSLDKTFQFAEDLYASQNYESAIEAYERVLFFDSSQKYMINIYPKIADSYFKTAEYLNANAYYELAYFVEKDSIAKNEILLKKASAFLILQDYDYAEIELLNLRDSVLTQKQIQTKTLQWGILKFAQQKYAESEASFMDVSNDTSATRLLFIKNNKVNKISPRKARILSMIMPGMGQFYVGDYKNGVNSFVLTIGLLALGARSAAVNSLLDAGIAVLPWFQRYYQGGYNKAELIAKAKIQEKRYKIYNELLSNIKQ